MTFAGLTLAAWDLTPFGISVGGGQFINFFGPTGPTPAQILAAQQATQLLGSAIPTNQMIGQVATNVHNMSARGINSRLFRVRGRIEGDDGIAQAGGGFARRGREVAVSRFMRNERELTVSSTLDLTGVSGQAAPVAQDHFEVNTLDAGNALSVTRPAGGNVDPGCLASGENWMIFGSANFGNVGLDNLGGNPGFDSYTYSSTLGLEYQVNENLALGAGWSHIWNDNTLDGGLGSVNMEGDAAMVYGTYFKNNFWSDLLYSYGSYEADIRRNALGGTSSANPDLAAHQLSLNLGYNIAGDLSCTQFAGLFGCDNRVVHGPTLGMDYSTGTLDGYTETGNAPADTTFAAQDYQSFITTLGWQATLKRETCWGHLRPQVRLGYGRENLNQETSVTGTLAGNPLISANRTNISPGDNWMELGLGMGVDLKRIPLGLYLDYTGQYFHQDAEVHYASLKAQMRF